jgi:hypothetical protein
MKGYEIEHSERESKHKKYIQLRWHVVSVHNIERKREEGEQPLVSTMKWK